ncbi:MAG: hypothetical protein WC760_04445 [Bacteroidia bacterium]
MRIALLVILFFPMPQQFFRIVKIKPLRGAIENREASKLTFESWFDESFQIDWEAFMNQHFGFREVCVRIHNQIDYSLFNRINARSAIFGKENYLYEENYIKAYLGTDYVGNKKIQEDMYRLLRVRDTLMKQGKNIMVVFAPGKGSFFPEYIPDSFTKQKKTQTNYAEYAKALKQAGIDFLDINQWFIQMKPNSPYPLYGKCGVHWSLYGEALAADTMIAFMNKTYGYHLPDLIIDTVKWEDKNRGGDYDMGDGLNMIFHLNTYPMGYPEFHFKRDTFTDSPKVMVMADSYYWGMYNFGMTDQVFGNGQFWYYNNEIYSKAWDKPLRLFDAEILDELNKHELIVILQTDAGLHRMSYGLIENLYDAYFTTDPTKSSVKKIRVAYIRKRLSESPKWITKLTQQAAREHITLEEKIKAFAEFLVWRERNGDPVPADYMEGVLQMKKNYVER